MKASHTAYVTALTAADLILPISRTASDDLLAWWREQGLDVERLPEPRPVPLAAEMVGIPRVTEPTASDKGSLATTPVRFLAVGTVEPRKNQLALLKALNRLHQRRPELNVRLDVVGGLHDAVAAEARREASQSGGRIQLGSMGTCLMRHCMH